MEKNKSVKKTPVKKNVAKTTSKEEKIKDKYLPIGTVAMLKGGRKRVIITGFCVSTPEKADEVWDYCGYTYPEGMISANQTLLFDHRQITKVYHMGLVDKEETTFKQKLKDYISHK